MKYYYLILLLVSLLPFSGCIQKQRGPLEDVLQLAGSNRKQLEQVINHYSTDQADSLKLKAAEFLILNMPGKYSISYNAPWEDAATVKLRWTSSSDKAKVRDTYKLGELEVKEDLKHISAEYLISNIELAFQVWNDKPWGKHISFDTFCEDILPYRISTEPLENWREKVLASFADINKAFKEDSTITAVEACSRVNVLLPGFRIDKDFSGMNYSQLMATTRGSCESQSLLAAFVMRGLGIPVTLDFTPQWKSRPTGHNWNSVRNSDGQYISFMGTESEPYNSHQGNTLQKAKAYRQTYRYHRLIETDKIHTPPFFQRNLYDISAEHDHMTTISIPVKYPPEIQTDYAYLTSLYDFEWRLTAHGKADSDSIYFQHIGKDIIYLPVYYTNERQTTAGEPFYLNEDGEVNFLIPDSSGNRISFNSITSEDDFKWISRMIEGIFESSEKVDFPTTTVLHTITEIPEIYNKVELAHPHTCRFIRYLSPRSRCNVSEISFFDIYGDELKGRHIGHPGSYSNSGNTGDKAFDGDIATFYDASRANQTWTGLDFGEEKQIASIHYSPRILGIGIYEGDVYELFCYIDDRWKSIEKTTATGPTIEFDIPRNALLYIHNSTKDKKGQVFFMLKDQVVYY